MCWGWASACSGSAGNWQKTDWIYWAKSRIIGGLGGLAANEQKYGVFDIGGRRDLDQAFDRMKDLVVNTGMCGLSLYSYGYGDADSNTLKAAQEQAIAAEVEKAEEEKKVNTDREGLPQE